MLLIPCPHCGPSSDVEFTYGEDASVTHHQMDPNTIDTAEWLKSVYLRNNPNGPHDEYWFHRDGCRKWLLVQRNTGTNEILFAKPAQYSGSHDTHE